MPTFFQSLLLSSVCSAAFITNSFANTDAPVSQTRNVILIVGDGMDEHQVTIARDYLVGASGRLLLDQMPVRSASQILTTEDKLGGLPQYVSDSANTATSMATGVVTSRGRISTTAGSDEDVPTIAELASAAGYRTGVVTTSSVTDATPAAFAAHISFRMCENPFVMNKVSFSDIVLGNCIEDLKKNGGKGSISEQLAESSLNVILGGGTKHFEKDTETGEQSVLELAKSKGFTVLTSPQDLLANKEPKKAERRLLGLFSESTMPVRLQGEDQRIAEKPKPSMLNHVHEYLGDVTMPDVMSCETNPDFESVPSLQQMTDVALAQLAYENEKGFFLMVESASIDKQSHERNACGSIGEVEQLNEALASAMDFAKSNPNTLILVTADHSQAAQLIPEVSLFKAYPIPIYSPGYIARIKTPEGAVMVVNYATNNFAVEEHTGAAVPLYSNSEGQGRVPAFVQQPELFTIMKDYLEL